MLAEAANDQEFSPIDVLDRLAGTTAGSVSAGDVDLDDFALDDPARPRSEFPARPANRDLRRDTALLDALGIVDVALERALDDENPGAALSFERILRDLLAARSVDANVATLRRLIAERRPTGPQAHLIYELLRVLPAPTRTEIYAADPEVEARLKAALPSGVRDSDFGPDLRMNAAVDTMLRILDAEDVWAAAEPTGENDTPRRLQPTTRSLLISILQGGGGSAAAEVATRYWREWMESELSDLGLEMADGIVTYSGSIDSGSVGSMIVGTESETTKGRLGAPYVPRGAEAVGWTGLSLERMLQRLTENYATWIDLAEVEKRRSTSERAGWGLYTVVAWPDFLEVSGTGFDIIQIDSLLDGMVFRVGSGSVTEWRIELAPESTPDSAKVLRLSADTIELRDVFFGMEGLSMSVARLAITGVDLRGDTTLGPGLNVKGKVYGTLDLLYAVIDGLIAIGNLTVQTLAQEGNTEGAVALASDILARLQGRFSSSMAATSIEAEGLVVGAEADGVGAVLMTEEVHIGEEGSEWQAFRANSQGGAENWDRLLALRVRRDEGDLGADERAELARLEQDALEVVLGVGLSRVEIGEIRLAVTQREKEVMEARVERIAADRIFVQADADPLDEEAGAGPHDLDASGDLSPLEALRASGTGSPEARLMQFHTIVHGLEVTPADSDGDLPPLVLDRLHFEAPTGEVRIEVRLASAEALELSVLAEGFVPEAAAHPSFPTPLAGDRTIHGVNVTAGTTTITIRRLDALMEALSGSEEHESGTAPSNLADYLRAMEGDLRFVVRALPGTTWLPEGMAELEVDARLERGGALTLTVPLLEAAGGPSTLPLLDDVTDIDDIIDFYQTHFPDTTPPDQAAAERNALRTILKEDHVDLAIDALRVWLEHNNQAHVEVIGQDVTWRPDMLEFGRSRTVTFHWGTSGGVPVTFTALAADGPILLDLTILPFDLPSVTGQLGHYHVAANGVHLDRAIKAISRLLDLTPDDLQVEIGGVGVREVWALGRGAKK